jgi:hypothetical protein
VFCGAVRGSMIAISAVLRFGSGLILIVGAIVLVFVWLGTNVSLCSFTLLPFSLLKKKARSVFLRFFSFFYIPA